MQEKQNLSPYRITILDNTHLDKSIQKQPSQLKNSMNYQHKLQTKSPLQRKPPQSSQKCCSFPESFKREILRIILIPLLIILFLLTIALTFKQNNYHTNDYFYSKNIEINRKIRGVVPPLNETKQNIFGEYRIGLVQKFNIESRRMFEDWKVQMWKNQSMKIIQTQSNGQCWTLYELKFYSSTIFISRIQSHIIVETNKTIPNEKNKNPGQISDQNITNSSESNSVNENVSNNDVKIQDFTLENDEKFENEENSDTVNSICSVDQWVKLNKILYESHIWTFGENNFYLLEFSQLGDDGNGVVIMNMIQKYFEPV